MNNQRPNFADRYTLDLLETRSKRVGCAWETCLLWKRQNIIVPDSRPTALKRLSSIERKLDNNPEYAILYYKEMDRLIDLGYAVELPGSTICVSQWYLPHFGITHTNKPGSVQKIHQNSYMCDIF